MLDVTNKQPSKLWPYLKTVAKAVKIPGTELTLGSLADLQDDLAKQEVSADDAQKETRAALESLLDHIGEIAASLAAIDDKLTADDLTDAAAVLAEAAYLRSVADQYLYSDFKGIEQLEKLVPLRLDDVFVNLRVRRERGAGERGEREAELLDRLLEAKGRDRDRAEQRLEELDVTRLAAPKRDAAPEPIDRVLRQPGTVLLGGPGSGKTTLVKRLARSLALGPGTALERYPDLPWCFPVVLPMAVYDDRGDGRALDVFVKARLHELGGRALAAAFDRRWDAGEVLVLLDGLDEVADSGRRVACARAAGDLVRGAGRNRVLVTSRPVGYGICRLSVPAEHVVLEPFGPDDIATFVRQWHLAYDRAVHPERPDPAAAARSAAELLEDVHGNPRVESLASNPLMLTIIALIKQQNVTLPERRVGLYEIALNTLIRSWNKARSLANRPIGEDLSAEETKKVWAAVAHWMHSERSTGTVHGAQLQEKLVDVLIDFGYPEHESERTAESYVRTAAERAGLLEERGTNVFAFMHQTFQEYLAARHLWLSRPRSQAIERVLAKAGDPRWHEVVRLTAGFVGVVQEDDEMVMELVEAIAAERDPLEPYLCGSLRLAASCIADDVRAAPRVAGAIVARICDRLNGKPHDLLVESLAETLRSMRTYRPDERATLALLTLKEHWIWIARQEAPRMLSRIAEQSEIACEGLRELLQDRDSDVRAHAALGLWQAGQREVPIAKAILQGLTSNYATMSAVRGLGLRTAFLKLLENEDASARIRAADVLGNWGHQEEATLALLKLLEDEEEYVRIRAAEVLGNWGHQAEATPTLLKLLVDEDASVQIRAAEVLGNWGHQAEATPALLKLLESDHASVWWSAAEVLGNWGHQAEATPALLKLLEAEEEYVRRSAAEVLGNWGHQAEATPALLKLLEGEDASVRIRAAEALGSWGHQAEATPALLKLLEDESASVRIRAASVLGNWRNDANVLRTVLSGLYDDIEPAVDFLGRDRPGPPSPETAHLLARLIEPRPDDTPEVAGRRDVVFRWLWQASQLTE